MLRRSYSVFICNYLTCLSLILLIQHLPGTSCSGKQKYAGRFQKISCPVSQISLYRVHV